MVSLSWLLHLLSPSSTVFVRFVDFYNFTLIGGLFLWINWCTWCSEFVFQNCCWIIFNFCLKETRLGSSVGTCIEEIEAWSFHWRWKSQWQSCSCYPFGSLGSTRFRSGLWNCIKKVSMSMMFCVDQGFMVSVFEDDCWITYSSWWDKPTNQSISIFNI